MHLKLTIKTDSAAEIAEVTQALAGRPRPGEALSAEDAEVLRGAGWRVEGDGLWFRAYTHGCDPMDHGLFDPRKPDGLRALRERTARIRMRGSASPAARGSLPKPDRVEAGQWWACDYGDGAPLWPFRVDRSTDRAAHGGSEGGTSTSGMLCEMLTDPRWRYLGSGERPAVPGSGERSPPIPGPTARDAVAGMLLRLGFSADARNLCSGNAGVAEMLTAFRRHYPAHVCVNACIAALEALAAREACRVGHGADDACAECAPGEQPESGSWVEADAGEQRDLVRVLCEALRRLVGHLEAEGRDGGGIIERAYDDYHAARMLVGRTDGDWDDAAAGRGIESIRREALGVENEPAGAGSSEGTPAKAAHGATATDREALGRDLYRAGADFVRERFPSLSLAGWESLPEWWREPIRRIGERIFAMGVEEGERRAAVQIPDFMRRLQDDARVELERAVQAERERQQAMARDLVSRWLDRMRGDRSANPAAIDAYAWHRLQGSADAIEQCRGELRAAFGVTGGQPPTGGEPGPEGPRCACDHPGPGKADDCDDVDNNDRCVCGCHAQPPADADERWRPGAVWEYQPDRFKLPNRLTISRISENGRHAVFDGGRWEAIAEMTPANGWRYIGRPASEAPPEEAAARADKIEEADADPIGARDAMINTLQRDLAKAQEESRAWANRWADRGMRLRTAERRGAKPKPHPIAAMERDERSAVERAHANGVVEGLRRARAIARRLSDGDRLGAVDLGSLVEAIDAYLSGFRPGEPMPADDGREDVEALRKRVAELEAAKAEAETTINRACDALMPGIGPRGRTLDEAIHGRMRHLDGEVDRLQDIIKAQEAEREALFTELAEARGDLHRTRASGAAEMRERAAPPSGHWATEARASGYHARARRLDELAEAIRALPLPAAPTPDAVVERVVREGLDVARVEVRPHLADGQRWHDSKRRTIFVQEGVAGELVCHLPFGQRVYFFAGAAAPDEWSFVSGPTAPNPGASEAPADGLTGLDAGGGP